MKKILYIILTIISVFFIYLEYSNRGYNYVSIGDSLIINNNYDSYIKDYLVKNNKLKNFNNYYHNDSILGLTEDIRTNRTIIINNEELYLKKVLRESDIVVINIGMSKIKSSYNKYDMAKNYYYFDKLYLKIENLVKEIRKYARGRVIFLGFYNPTNYYDSETDKLFYDINLKIRKIMNENNVFYIDLYEIVKSNHYKDEEEIYILNSYGNKAIFDIIKHFLED